jgi:SNF2 family DNA or RNA helicase
MLRLEDITVDSQLAGLLPSGPVTVKHVRRFGDQAAEITYLDAAGATGSELVFRDREPQLELLQASRPLSFTADGDLFKLASEAQRIHWGHLFDPMIAVNTSAVDPLPHQITAVYETMLNRQPLRFLLADDPGAGKTIMTGLLIKELIIRGDVAKCLIVAPGSLVEQWQDELDEKFSLAFDILTNEGIQASRSGNWFQEHDLCIARLDKLSRNEDIQEQLKTIDWDLVIVDEAHKMSASYFGNEVTYTKRFRLGQLLSEHCRQFLLLTATPHNGKEEDFQLFMSLLDGDRFEGRVRKGSRMIDASDLMRRLVKEQLVTMEGKPLFPERFAYTLQFELSDSEAALYAEVTDYVRTEFNRADNLEKGRRGTVGFALMILQRRLASSPEAIYQSLRRRRERLEKRLREEKLLKRGAEIRLDRSTGIPDLSEEEIDDLEDAPEGEFELAELEVIDLATTAATISELEQEIATLKRLEEMARQVRNSNTDTKWQKLAEALSDNPLMFDASGQRRKLVIFTEHRDTLAYLHRQLRILLGGDEAIVSIHGQTPRDERRKIQERFTQDPSVLVLLATDAAGEGINLQRAHLMINYDLPWNPNRLEQRFGRIHRIGQREVCHLWNLVAENTREGEVYLKLLKKLEQEREALGGAVFDVLGQTFQGTSLRDILIEAIRKGDLPETKARLDHIIDEDLDTDHLRSLIRGRSLTREEFGDDRVQHIRAMMERAEARKLQPHYIGSFFEAAFESFGGKLLRREPGRFEIKHVPAEIRLRDRLVGSRAPVLKSYERVTFEKARVRFPGKPPAAFIAPGHPLLVALIDLVLEKYRPLLRQGAALVDPGDSGTDPRFLAYLENTITDGRKASVAGESTQRGRILSRQFEFIQIRPDGTVSPAGYAPYLDFAAATEAQMEQAASVLSAPWLERGIEDRAVEFAVARHVPDHLREVRQRREAHIRKAEAQIHDRLTREIMHWNNRAVVLEEKERAGKSHARLNSTKARARAEALAERLQFRMAELQLEKQISAHPPRVLGGALVIPGGWLAARQREEEESSIVREDPPEYRTGGGGPENTAVSEKLAMDAVIAYERAIGNEPRDVSAENLGYDIESRNPETGALRFIEVKGRAQGASYITLTRNELLTALNKPESWWLAIVLIDQGRAAKPIYVKEPFREGLPFFSPTFNFQLDHILNPATSA